MRPACIMKEDLLIKKDIYMKINKLKLLGTHLYTLKYFMIYKPHLRSYVTFKHVASIENKPWHATQRQRGHFIHCLTALLSLFLSPSSLSESLSTCSLTLTYSPRSPCAAHRKSLQTLLVQQHSAEFFLTYVEALNSSMDTQCLLLLEPLMNI